MTPELKRVQENMQPGVITAEGFLGDDTRNLSTLLDEDAQLFGQFGIKPPEAAERLRYLMEKGRKGLGEPVTVDGRWLVSTTEARGRLACPWEDGIYAKINVNAKHIKSGQTLFFTDLSVHLLEKHHFIEGNGSSFRLDPQALKLVVEDITL